ncbi:hypothetical protein KO494_09200 [Lacinutrix sp. C3R15]|uniref:hypothetical protein n=1 Tax=Flavobacteriaceae TaxID=49546 RepID=UPI001C09E297|nr:MULTISPECIES: hypothetical protein [Flavobacteriaceae]MBU2939713.1 hypothetical protein [Lacinutrix sp. C3R15]MDO6623028.1 hypothetical protein [Oceanihabitans sp. 1_MG-2023]
MLLKKNFPSIKLCHTILLFFFFSIPALAQEIETPNNCSTGYTFETKSVYESSDITKDIEVSWNFLQANNKEHLDLIIEIQPLNACWQGVNATNRSEKTSIPIENFRQSYKGELMFTFSQLNSKCIKWRAKIINSRNNCTNYTPWTFSSLL